MDKLILIPVLIIALYFIYRYIRRSLKGEGCHGDCANCSLASKHSELKSEDCIHDNQSKSN